MNKPDFLQMEQEVHQFLVDHLLSTQSEFVDNEELATIIISHRHYRYGDNAYWWLSGLQSKQLKGNLRFLVLQKRMQRKNWILSMWTSENHAAARLVLHENDQFSWNATDDGLGLQCQR